MALWTARVRVSLKTPEWAPGVGVPCMWWRCFQTVKNGGWKVPGRLARTRLLSLSSQSSAEIIVIGGGHCECFQLIVVVYPIARDYPSIVHTAFSER